MSYALQFLNNFLAIAKDPAHYLLWAQRRTGLIVANELLDSGYKALEIGCGCGANFHLLKKAGRIDAFDVDPEFEDFYKKGKLEELKNPCCPTHVFTADVETFKSDELYDLIYSIWVLWDRHRPTGVSRSLNI